MDKRFKPLTSHEQLVLREELASTIQAHPEWDFPAVARHIRKTLRLTLADMSKVSKLSVPALKNIECGHSSPTLQSAERLLAPFGLALQVGPRQPPK